MRHRGKTRIALTKSWLILSSSLRVNIRGLILKYEWIDWTFGTAFLGDIGFCMWKIFQFKLEIFKLYKSKCYVDWFIYIHALNWFNLSVIWVVSFNVTWHIMWWHWNWQSKLIRLEQLNPMNGYCTPILSLLYNIKCSIKTVNPHTSMQGKKSHVYLLVCVCYEMIRSIRASPINNVYCSLHGNHIDGLPIYVTVID